MKTFPQLVEHHAQANARGVALRHKRRGMWTAWSWQATAQEIRATACGLASIGIKRGDRIVIGGQNIPELYWTLVASQCVGCIPIPLDCDVDRDDLISLLNRFEVKVAVVRNRRDVDLLLDINSQCPTLREIVFVEASSLYDQKYRLLTNFSELLQAGSKYDLSHPDFYCDALATLSEDDLAVIVHTAGTTAAPKAIGLSHRNLVNTALGIVEHAKLTPKDELIAYLPLSWANSIVFGYAIWLVAAATLNCPESERTVFDNMKEIKPTFFFAPPKIYKHLLVTSNLRMESSPWLNRYLFCRAYETALRVCGGEIRGKSPSLHDKIVLRCMRIIVFNGLRRAFGLSQIRLALTGMEVIGPGILAFFRGMGINLKQSYGLTETSGSIAINHDHNVKWNCIGPAIKGVEIALDQESHILVRASHLGGAASQLLPLAKANYEADWLRTDDLGRMDASGNIQLVGRDDDSGDTGPSRLHNAAVIEAILRASLYVKDAFVFKGNQNTLLAFLTLEEGIVSNWANRRAICCSGYSELISREEVHDLLREIIRRINRTIEGLIGHDLPVSRFLILPRPFCKQAGELTRSWTIHRKNIEKRFPALIDAMQNDCVEIEFVDSNGRYKLSIVDVRDVPPVFAVGDVPLNAGGVRLSNA